VGDGGYAIGDERRMTTDGGGRKRRKEEEEERGGVNFDWDFALAFIRILHWTAWQKR
jgi:hypothetical protein